MTSRVPTPLPFVDHLERESLRFATVLADADPAARVPTCPDWSADDLLWHLAEVQWFWGEIVEQGVTERGGLDAVEAARVGRPAEREGLLAFFDRASTRLHRVLSQLPADTERWMWADDHTVGYIARRQAHEALVHRLDAELTTGQRTALDPLLSADGVDEALVVMRGHEDDPGEPGLAADPLGGAVVLSAVDTMHSWTVTPLRVHGTDSDGDELDVLALDVAQGARPDVTTEVCGTAADLDAWLWNRPPAAEITRVGDAAALAALDRVVARDID